jgi:hypothetical protein
MFQVLDIVRFRLQMHVPRLLGLLRAQIVNVDLAFLHAINLLIILLHLLEALVIILDAIINVVLDRLLEDGMREHLHLARISFPYCVDLCFLRVLLVL